MDLLEKEKEIAKRVFAEQGLEISFKDEPKSDEEVKSELDELFGEAENVKIIGELSQKTQQSAKRYDIGYDWTTQGD